MLTLETLEGEHEDQNPPATYARGFLRAYALELELDPEEILSIYDEELAELQKAAPSKKPQVRSGRMPGYLVPVIAGAVLLLACALYFGYMGRISNTSRQKTVDTSVQKAAPPAKQPARKPAGKPAPKPAEQPLKPAAKEPAAKQAGPAVPDAPKAPAAATVDTAPKAEPEAPQPFTVRFQAGERSWMRFTLDDRKVFDVILQAGEMYSVRAEEQARVRIGNPGGLKAFFNDAPIAVPGRPGRPVTMSFPPDADPSR